MSDRIGQRFGNYRLIRLLGRGGFAEVYLGQHIRLGTQAAIKVLYAHLAQEDKEQFQREAQIIARLVHPHIVRVLDFDVEEDIPFLVMDYAPNGPLHRRYPRGTILPLQQVLTYVKQVSSALQYAHDQQLIHRDVKPENMLVSKRQDILLSDFGIAVIAHSTLSQRVEMMSGTIHYMAPEQIQGRPRFASDQYALGITAYEWLAGGRPFKGTAAEVAMQHNLMPAPPLRERRADVPAAVEQVIMKTLAKDPRARFARVQDFAFALEEAYHSTEPGSPPFVIPVPPGSQSATSGEMPPVPGSQQPVRTPPSGPPSQPGLSSSGPHSAVTPVILGRSGQEGRASIPTPVVALTPRRPAIGEPEAERVLGNMTRRTALRLLSVVGALAIGCGSGAVAWSLNPAQPLAFLLPQNTHAAVKNNGKPSPSFKHVSEATLNMALQYPDNWKTDGVSQSSTNVSLLLSSPQDPQTAFMLTRILDAASATITNADEVNQEGIALMSVAHGMNNLQPTPNSASQPIVAGTTWSQQNGTFEDYAKVAYDFAILATQHNKQYYKIVYFMPDKGHNTILNTYIKPVLDSLQFLS
ncbi:serine/threonine protein kinase [Ktedonosporobacter rubrisoli]|uniref:serine/threonine protein kinase n=1 Tax=Ktedonosporobacter rubrisoli TaxID=2509675 RepID=UPI0013EE555D|nr:serine/threonine-protein kinase [Ktedonosporobacter rubrisoli]